VLFSNRVSTGAIALALLAAISLIPSVGVILGFLFVLLAQLLGRRQGSFAEIGFRRPASWWRTILLGVGIGIVAQIAFSVVIDPLLGNMTGKPIDVSAFDAVRGNIPNYLILLAVGWVVGGFLEEMLFRGYLLGRIRRGFGGGQVATLLAVILPAIAFGLAHHYQGPAGMISTGLLGTLLGAVFVRYRENLWLPILVHGSLNTIGITLIFISGDRVLNAWLFG
jgi:membrane protease YdiL (CAAX protease family)